MLFVAINILTIDDVTNTRPKQPTIIKFPLENEINIYPPVLSVPVKASNSRGALYSTEYIIYDAAAHV